MSSEITIESLTIYDVETLKETLMKACVPEAQLILDLAQVEEFDAAGFQLLIATQKELHQLQGSLLLKSASENVIKGMQAIGVESLFEQLAA